MRDNRTGSAQELTRWYTADLETGQLLELKDLFADGADYVDPISEEIRGQMQRQLAEDPHAGWLLRSEKQPTGFWEIAPDQSFTLTEDGRLVIAFDEGEAGIGALGAVELRFRQRSPIRSGRRIVRWLRRNARRRGEIG